MSQAKQVFTVDAQCSDCGGTGIYQGMAERDGAGVVCHTCGGTGCEKIKVGYRPFEKKVVSPKIKWVVPVNCGICVGNTRHSFRDFGGQSYEDWLDGKPLSRNFEMRKFTCPCWYYQSFDSDFKPEWKECWSNLGSSFSECKHFCDKSTCWARWDKELGFKAYKKHKIGGDKE